MKLRALTMMPSRVTWNFSTSILINILEKMIMADLAFWYKLMFATVCEVKLSPKSWTESRNDSDPNNCVERRLREMLIETSGLRLRNRSTDKGEPGWDRTHEKLLVVFKKIIIRF